MIDLRSFIIAIQTAWIPRALQNTNDNWKYDILSYYNLRPETLAPINDDIQLGKVLTGLSKSFELFREKYWQIGNNFLASNIFYNPNFGHGRKMENIFTLDIFTGNTLSTENILNYTWNDFREAGVKISNKNTLENKIGCTFNADGYENLKINFNI